MVPVLDTVPDMVDRDSDRTGDGAGWADQLDGAPAVLEALITAHLASFARGYFEENAFRIDSCCGFD